MSKPGDSAKMTVEQKEKCRIRDRARYQRDHQKRSAANRLAYKLDPGKFKAQKRAAYAADPEKFRARIKRRTPEQIAKYQATQKRNRLANRDVENEKIRLWRIANKDKVRATKKRYYEKNKADILKRGAASRKRRRDKVRETNRRWRSKPESKAKIKASRENQKDTIRHGWRMRRARINNAVGSHTAQQVADLFVEQCGMCAGCGAGMHLSGKWRYHVDHYLALALGGKDSVDNLQLLCRPCNQAKGKASPEIWESTIKPRRVREQAEESRACKVVDTGT